MDVTVAGLVLKSGATRFTLAASSATRECEGGSVLRRAGFGRGCYTLGSACFALLKTNLLR